MTKEMNKISHSVFYLNDSVKEATENFVNMTACIDKYSLYHTKLISCLNKIKQVVESDSVNGVESDIYTLEDNLKRLTSIHDEIESTLGVIVEDMKCCPQTATASVQNNRQIEMNLIRLKKNHQLLKKALKKAIEDYNQVVDKYHLELEK